MTDKAIIKLIARELSARYWFGVYTGWLKCSGESKESEAAKDMRDATRDNADDYYDDFLKDAEEIFNKTKENTSSCKLTDKLGLS